MFHAKALSTSALPDLGRHAALAVLGDFVRGGSNEHGRRVEMLKVFELLLPVLTISTKLSTPSRPRCASTSRASPVPRR